jgi:hypothetical protein
VTTQIEAEAIEGTEVFFDALIEGKITSPYDAVEILTTEYAPLPPESAGEDARDLWEVAIVGTVARMGSVILGTYPVVILDWDPECVYAFERVPSYCFGGGWNWKEEDRPRRRPAAPRRVTDAALQQVALENIARAAPSEEGRLLMLPVLGPAGTGGSSYFEGAVLAIFPAGGAWAFRRAITTRNQWARRAFEELAPGDAVFSHILLDDAVINFDELRRQHAGREAFQLASVAGGHLIRQLAGDFRKKR